MRIGLTTLLLGGIILAHTSCGESSKNPSTTNTPGETPELPGYVLENEFLHLRVVDNSERYFHNNDAFSTGMNGLAVLIHKDQRKNIYSFAGLNLECTRTDPPAGKYQDLWNAPRVAPMRIRRISDSSVMLGQSAEDASGLNFEVVFTLHGQYVDQVITCWPDHDIGSSSSFWASYMNQVQYTSLFLRAPPQEDQGEQWFEITSAGHSAEDGLGVYARGYDPFGLEWHEHLADNPLLRQEITETPASRQATLDAGFKPYPQMAMDHFYYGLIDEYLYLMIFREPEFSFWISASGSETLRQPAWDYQIISGPQKAGEKRSYHVRLVYKPFAGIEDILAEVARFVNEN